MILVGTILMVFALEFFLIWFSQHRHPVTVTTTWTIHMALAIAVVTIMVSTSNTWSMFVPFLSFLAGGLSLYLWIGVSDARKRGAARLAYMTLYPSMNFRPPQEPELSSPPGLWWKRAAAAAIFLMLLLMVVFMKSGMTT
jgi:hypothetical protein